MSILRRRNLLIVAIGLGLCLGLAILLLLSIQSKTPVPAPDTTTEPTAVAPDKIDSAIEITEDQTEQVLVSTSQTLTETEHLKIVRTYDNLPLLLVEVDSIGLESLRSDPAVENVAKNIELELFEPEQTVQLTPQSVSVQATSPNPISTIGGNMTDPLLPNYSDGSHKYAGSADSGGYEVVVADTGTDYNHTALAGTMVAEACFNSSTNGAYVSGVKLESQCPNGDLSSSAAGAGMDCSLVDCGHGTMVAGSVAMKRVTLTAGTTNETTSGSAPAANIIAVKVASKQTYQTTPLANNPCEKFSAESCIVLNFSDILAAMDYTINLADSRPKIVAINLSLGGGAFNTVTTCRAGFGTALYDAFKSAIDKLSAKGIATIIATGNGGYNANQGKIAFPSCVEGAVAVGATSVNGSHMAYYSQNGNLTTLLAPGGDYTDGDLWGQMLLPANGTGNGFVPAQGTSFAAPTVAGAYAVLRSKWPNMSVDDMTSLLASTGTPLTDSRTGYGSLAKPRINVAAALASNSVAALSSASTDYTIDADSIDFDQPVSIKTLMGNISTPFGYRFKNAGTLAFASGLTPYDSAAKLTNANAMVTDSWTFETESYPIDSYTPQSFAVELQDVPPPDPTDPDSVDLLVSINSVLSLSLDKPGLGITLNPTAEVTGTDKVVVSVDTNSPNGYNASLSATSPSLICQSHTNLTIPPLLNSGSLAVGRWGYGVGTVSAPPSTWRAANILPTVFDSLNSITAGPRNSYLYVGAKANTAAPAACPDYQTTLTITALPNS
jgi:hypothetical protein